MPQVLEWGAGLKQREDKRSRREEEEKLAKQPFSRFVACTSVVCVILNALSRSKLCTAEIAAN